jgi:hypothetical protein
MDRQPPLFSDEVGEVAVHLNGQTATSFFTATSTSCLVYPEKRWHEVGEVAAAITVERHEVEVAVHQNGQTATSFFTATSHFVPPLFSHEVLTAQAHLKQSA